MSRQLITCTPGTVANPADIPLALKLLDADSKLPKEQRLFNRADTLHAHGRCRFRTWRNKLAQAGDEPISDGLRAYLLAKAGGKGSGECRVGATEFAAESRM